MHSRSIDFLSCMFTAIHAQWIAVIGRQHKLKKNAQHETSFESACEIINGILQIGVRGNLTDAKCIGETTLKIPETERA